MERHSGAAKLIHIVGRHSFDGDSLNSYSLSRFYNFDLAREFGSGLGYGDNNGFRFSDLGHVGRRAMIKMIMGYQDRIGFGTILDH